MIKQGGSAIKQYAEAVKMVEEPSARASGSVCGFVFAPSGGDVPLGVGSDSGRNANAGSEQCRDHISK